MKKESICRSLLLLFFCILLMIAGVVPLTGAFSYYTDYEAEHLQAVSGVSLHLSKGTGISSVKQEGYILEQDEAGWYKAGDIANLDADVEAGYVFDGWYQDDVMISKVENLSFTVTEPSMIEARASLIDDGTSEEEAEKLVALILDNSGDETNPLPMVFAMAPETITVGDQFESEFYGPLTVLYLYTGFEDVDIGAVSDTHSEKIAAVPWVDQKKNVTSVVVEDEFSPISTAFWFYQFQNCMSIDVSKLNTSRLMNAAFAFYDAGALADSILITGLDDWDVSKVIDMESMFENTGYYSTTFDIGSLDRWNVGKVKNMKGMFRDSGYKTEDWKIGNLSQWDTSSVEDMEYMFYNAGRRSLTFDIGDIGGWDVSHIGTMRRMFYNAGYYATTYYIGELDDWDVSNVENMEGVFYGSGYSAGTWSVGDLSRWQVGNVKTMALMFGSSGRKAPSWSVGNLGSWDVSKVEKMQNMFDNAGYAASYFYVGDLQNWKPVSATNMNYVFYNAGYSAVWSLDCSGWDVANVTTHNGFNRGVTSKVTEPIWN